MEQVPNKKYIMLNNKNIDDVKAALQSLLKYLNGQVMLNAETLGMALLDDLGAGRVYEIPALDDTSLVYLNGHHFMLEGKAITSAIFAFILNVLNSIPDSKYTNKTAINFMHKNRLA